MTLFIDHGCGVIPSPKDDRDYCISSVMKSPNFPKEFSLQKKLLPIRNQLNTSMCAAFSGACVKEYHEFKDCNVKEFFSPEYIYNLRSDRNIDGMYLRDLMKIMQKHGVPRERFWQFRQPSAINIDNANSDAQLFKIKNYAKAETVSDVKTALMNSGPCVIAVPVYNTQRHDIWRKNKNETMIGGHAMVIVGWTKQDNFVIRNSWGEGWGFKGYTYMPFKDFEKSVWDCYVSYDSESTIPIPDTRPPSPTNDNKGVKSCCFKIKSK